jgi:hypothetical protein
MRVNPLSPGKLAVSIIDAVRAGGDSQTEAGWQKRLGGRCKKKLTGTDSSGV